MCGRFTVSDEIYDIRISVTIQFEQLFRPWYPSYNISPSAGEGHEQLIAVVDGDGNRILKLARWWFIPPTWAQPLNLLPTTFNARADQLANGPMWRNALRASRYLVPANGWREFTGPAGDKQPYHFHFDHKLFTFAGLSSTWRSPDGGLVDTFAIVTTDANSSIADIHDRMPLIVPKQYHDDWLSKGTDPVTILNELCAQSRHLNVKRYASDRAANDVRYEGPLAIREATIQQERTISAQRNLFDQVPEYLPSGHRRRRKSK